MKHDYCPLPLFSNPEPIPLWVSYFLVDKNHFSWYTVDYEAVLFGDLMRGHLTVNAEGTLSSKILRLREFELRVYYAVKEAPGISFPDLMSAIGVNSRSSLRYHTYRMKRKGLIKEIKNRHLSHFFTVRDHGYAMELAIVRFARPTEHKIAELLLTRPMNGVEMCRSLGCRHASLIFHLKHMVKSGDLQRERIGRTVQYSLVNPELVRRVFAPNKRQ